MMDTQRLVALIIFSVSALFLWEAWQKHNAPKIVTTTSTVPALPTNATPGAGSVPVAGTPGASVAAPSPPSAAPAATTGEPITLKTALLDVELNLLGGGIPPLAMR